MSFECRQTSEAQNLAALQATIALQLNEPPLTFASLEGARDFSSIEMRGFLLHSEFGIRVSPDTSPAPQA